MPASRVPIVELLSKPECHLCHEAKAVLLDLQSQVTFTVREIDITIEPELWAQYQTEIPVVFINGRKVCKYRVDQRLFLRAVQRAAMPLPSRFWRLA